MRILCGYEAWHGETHPCEHHGCAEEQDLILGALVLPASIRKDMLGDWECMSDHCDMPVSDGESRHDSLCRPASRDVLTNRMGCDCELIDRVREDERAADHEGSE